ncbi:MAG: hypothetical protein NTY68_04000 [Candidatus Micrarchaeota archaeon]|nr:hypothetical protein [Candidatus Micrarchaeota archaeon]
MKSTCPRTRILTIFFLSILFLATVSFAQSELVLNKTGDHNVNDNITCFDYYNGSIYLALESNRYLPILSYPNLESSQRVSEDFNINCVNTMSDGRVLYITKRAVYQTLPTVGEIFEFNNIQEIRDYKGGFLVLTGYNKIYGIDKNGNMTLGLPFEYRIHNFTGIGTDGTYVYVSDNESRIFVLDSKFNIKKTINISCTCPIKNLYVYGKGGDVEILLTTEDGVDLIRDDTEYDAYEGDMDRCILINYGSVMCSKGTYLDFFSIANVSDKVEKYKNLSLSIENILENSTNCSYAVWAAEQLNRSKSINDIDEALKVIYNISLSNLQTEDCVKKAPPVAEQNITKNETVERNTTPGTKNGTGAVSTASQAQATALPLLAVLIIAVIIAAAAYFLLNRKKKNGGYSRFNK